MKKKSGHVEIVSVLIHFVVIKRIWSIKYSNAIYEFIGWLFVYVIVKVIFKLTSKKIEE